LKELETTSHSNSKIGLKTIQETIKKLEALEEDISRQIEKLENSFANENNSHQN
jgi:predicted DNA-binding transcriptional regulator